jgi:hypothetical protein
MATPLSSRLTFAADPAGAFGLLTDPGYLEEVAVATGGQDVEVRVTPSDDGGATVVSVRSLPAEVPSYARALVGDTVRLTETRVIGPAAADGSRAGTVSVSFAGAPVTMEGTLTLHGDAAASAVDVAMSIKASVPFVGGKIEKFCAEQIERALAKEEEVAATRLA